MTELWAVDPGTLQSALVVVRRSGPFGIEVLSADTLLNAALLDRLPQALFGSTLVLEQIASFGMPVGAEVFETVFWTGRFYEAWPAAASRYRLPRSAIKMHLCQSMRAKDSNIRQALADRFGGSNAWGTKRAPGPLYGVKGHEMAALAVAVTWLETQHLAVESAVTRA